MKNLTSAEAIQILKDKKSGVNNASYTTPTEGIDSARMAITSHLSDVEAMTGYDEDVNLRCEFVKFLVHKYFQNVDVDIEKEFELFKNK